MARFDDSMLTCPSIEDARLKAELIHQDLASRVPSQGRGVADRRPICIDRIESPAPSRGTNESRRDVEPRESPPELLQPTARGRPGRPIRPPVAGPVLPVRDQRRAAPGRRPAGPRL